MRSCLTAFCLTLLIGAAPAADPKPPASGLVPGDVLGFLHVDVSALAAKESVRGILDNLAAAQGRKLADASQEMFGVALTDIDSFCLMMGEKFEIVAVRTRKPYDRDKVLEVLVPGGEEQTHKGKKFYAPPGKRPGGDILAQFGPAAYFLDDHTYVFSKVRNVRHFIEKSAKPDEDIWLQSAYTKAREHPITFAMSPPAEVTNTIKREMREDAGFDVSKAIVNYALRPLLDTRRLLVTAEVGDQSRLEATFGFGNADDAAAGQDAARVGLGLLLGGLNFLDEELATALGEEGKKSIEKVQTLLRELKKGLRGAQVTLDGRQLKVSVRATTDEALVKAALVEVLPQVQLSAARAQSANNLKQLAIAAHNYHDANTHLPPAWSLAPPQPSMFDRQKKPLGLSWRVHLLPYIEQENLYRQFRLNEPWDSEHNKKLIPMMPQLYAPVGGVQTKEKGMTFYQGVTTSNMDQLQSVFPIAMMGPAPRVNLAAIADGTSNTLLFVEAAEAVIWTKPDDVSFDGKEKLLPKLGGLFKDGFHAARCDGSVQYFRKKTMTEDFLKAFVSRQGGEVVPEPEGQRRDGIKGRSDGASAPAPQTGTEPKTPPPQPPKKSDGEKK